MSYQESAFFFESQGEMLPGIVTTRQPSIVRSVVPADG